MVRGAFGQQLCASGREADFGGRWTKPCYAQPARHKLGTSYAIPTEDGFLHFCDEHMAQLIAAGLVTDPNLTDEELNALIEKHRRNAT